MIVTAYRSDSSGHLRGRVQSQHPITPSGGLIRIKGLTSKYTKQWIIHFKAEITASIRSKLIFLNKALRRYQLAIK